MAEFSNVAKRTTGDMLKIIKTEFLYGEPGQYKPMLFIGKGGIGKSAGVRGLINSLSEETGQPVGYKDIRLTNFDPVDLKGVPVPDMETKTTLWLVNNCYPDADRDGERGILVLDEITSATEQTQTAVYQLLAERELNGYKFPDGWMIVCLGNGEEDGGTYNQLTANFGNRCQVCYIESDKEDWLKWARGAGVHELVLAYVSWENSTLHGYNPSLVGLDNVVFPSPRAYTRVSQLLNYKICGLKDKTDKIPKIIRDMIVDTIGLTEGNKFLAFVDARESLIDIDEIFNGKAQPISAYGTKDLDKLMSLSIEGIISKTEKLCEEYEKAKGAAKTKKLQKLQGTLKNIIEWLRTTPISEYAVRYLTAILGDTKKIGESRTVSDVMYDVLWFGDFSKICPAFEEYVGVLTAISEQ